MQSQYIQLIADKTNAADVTGGVFALLVSVVPTEKIQNLLPFRILRQKLANGDVTKKTLNCTAFYSS